MGMLSTAGRRRSFGETESEGNCGGGGGMPDWSSDTKVKRSYGGYGADVS